MARVRHDRYEAHSMSQILVRYHRRILPHRYLLDGHGWYLGYHDSAECVCQWWFHAFKVENHVLWRHFTNLDVDIVSKIFQTLRIELAHLGDKTGGMLKSLRVVHAVQFDCGAVHFFCDVHLLFIP